MVISNNIIGLIIIINDNIRSFNYVIIDCDDNGHLLVLGFGGAKKEKKKKKKKKSKKPLVDMEHGTIHPSDCNLGSPAGIFHRGWRSYGFDSGH